MSKEYKVCVIPARAGSKRIPQKNIKSFCGRPIIEYAIEAARNSGCFDRVVVSTDDADIKNVAEAAGAEVPFMRPDDLSGDVISVLATVKHAIEWFRANDTAPYFACLLYATAPFVDEGVLMDSLEELKNAPNKKFCLGVTEFRYPIQRAVYMQDGGLRMFYPEHFHSRSQDLKKAYHDAGQFCWGLADAFVEEKPVFESHTLPFVLPSFRVQDIDTPEDWHHAELMYGTYKKTTAE